MERLEVPDELQHIHKFSPGLVQLVAALLVLPVLSLQHPHDVLDQVLVVLGKLNLGFAREINELGVAGAGPLLQPFKVAHGVRDAADEGWDVHGVLAVGAAVAAGQTQLAGEFAGAFVADMGGWVVGVGLAAGHCECFHFSNIDYCPPIATNRAIAAIVLVINTTARASKNLDSFMAVFLLRIIVGKTMQ